MVNLISVGIDPGPAGGGVSIIKEDLTILELTTAPFYITKSSIKKKVGLNKKIGKYEISYKKFKWLDEEELLIFFKPYFKNYEVLYTLESVFVKPFESTYTGFIFGNCLGIHKAIRFNFDKLKEYNHPKSQEWKGFFNISENKEESVELANKIFEKQLLEKFGKLLSFQTSNSNKHQDLAEALLLSLYGLDQYFNKEKR